MDMDGRPYWLQYGSLGIKLNAEGSDWQQI